MSKTYFEAPQRIDREDVEQKWKDLTNTLGNQGTPIDIIKLKESQDAEEKKLGVKTYEFCFEVAGRETVFQTIHDTFVRWNASCVITAAESKRAKTAHLQMKYHMFNTIEKLRIAGTSRELDLERFA